jgi:hypothetical protein
MIIINYSIQFFIYLCAELNSQWPITESARIQTTAIRQHMTKQTTKTTTKETTNPKRGSLKAFYTQIRLIKMSVDLQTAFVAETSS